MDTTIKVTSIHIVFGLIAALLSAALSLGWLGFKNDVFAFFVAVIILYFVGQFCQKFAGEEISGFSQWLWDGISPFYFTWVIAYTLFVMYL
ncbi:MAG: DUF5379 family protein [Methanobrevibacter sp.]|uniref:EMC6-like membrane protein n=1 Tax=Methanobrevibacter sp. TaxID=66852 RepID=UPI001B46B6CB|nr:hypothetical protein [Methanobrevibacter sp.]MBP3791260.1 DUF5379 family protein [Methanobrevibacter sp.]